MASIDQDLTDALVTDYCDNDATWGPLLFLRPGKREPFGILRSLGIALLPGVPLGLVGSMLFAMLARQVGQTPLPLYFFSLVLTLGQFVLFRIIVAPAWNRRAARLARKSTR